MGAAFVPAGWYPDPSGRHEQRYWDGFAWSGHVLDRGVASEDALPYAPAGSAPPPPAMAPAAFPASPASSAPPGPPGQFAWSAPIAAQMPGYRAVRLPSWRWLTSAVAQTVGLVAFFYELLALGVTAIVGPGDDVEWIWIWSWVYRRDELVLYIARPPVLVVALLFLAALFLSLGPAGRSVTLARAGARTARWWSSAEDRQRWSGAVYRFDATGVSHTASCRGRERAFLIVSAICFVLVIVLAVVAITNREAATSTGVLMSHLSIGLGPWFCLTAGILGVLGALVSWPWGGPEMVIRADGSVSPAR
jgi:hypothetical protein